MANGQLCVLRESDNATIFRSPLIPIEMATTKMKAAISSPGNDIELYLNGKVLGKGKDALDTCAVLEDRMNVLGVKMSGAAGPATGTFSIGEMSFPLTAWTCSRQEKGGWLDIEFDDGKWALHGGEKAEGMLFLRHILIKSHTKFSPQLERNTMNVANGAAMFVGIQRSSPFEKRALENYTVRLSLPDAMKIPLYEPEKRRWYRYGENVHSFSGKETGGRSEFTFSYKNPIPKLPYEGGVFNVGMIVFAEFPESDGRQSLEGTMLHHWAGLARDTGGFQHQDTPALERRGAQEEHPGSML